MIVKVQTSLYPPGKTALIYNCDRSFQVEIVLLDEVRSLMGDRIKAFFEVRHTLGHDGVLQIEFLREAPWQKW